MEIYKIIDGKIIYNVGYKNIFMVKAGLMIDADGAPKAYNKNDEKALDYLHNGGQPGNWWALVTDNKMPTGNPIVQTIKGPAPGYYISMTALEDETKDYTDQHRYVNSELVPYIVIPPNFSDSFKLGDIALVVNKKNNKRCFAIVADIGPAGKFGEGSIYLANQLGVDSDPKNGGTDLNEIVYILIKNSGKNKVMNKKEIEQTGKLKLADADIKQLLK